MIPNRLLRAAITKAESVFDHVHFDGETLHAELTYPSDGLGPEQEALRAIVESLDDQLRDPRASYLAMAQDAEEPPESVYGPFKN